MSVVASGWRGLRLLSGELGEFAEVLSGSGEEEFVSCAIGAGSSTNLNLARRDLMTPDEVMRLPEGNLITLRLGAYAAWARKVQYFADAESADLADA